MTTLLDGLRDNTNFAYTENGALVRDTTNNACLDFFSLGGAKRNSGGNKSAVNLFDRAWSEDKLTALRTMFYFRDVRGGQGQRAAFREQLVHLASIAPETLRKNLHLVPEYGRWDDLYALVGTDLEKDVFALMKTQFKNDMVSLENGDNVSLLGKWLKSENTSSKESRALAVKTRHAFNLTSKQYRKALSALRARIRVVERDMCQNKWNKIEYKAVPSNAMLRYRKAFARHDEVRFNQYISRVHSGEEKINADTLYPYDIVHRVFQGNDIPKSLDALWKALPDYVDGSENSIAVVDTSGSMYGTPIEVAISLGIYFAERLDGPYKDHFITFSAQPKLQKITGTDITRKVHNLNRAHWDMNTNIEAVFELILDVAIKNNLSQDEMLDKVYIISDMQFDAACGSHGYYRATSVPEPDQTLFNALQIRYHNAGYKMPLLVFWNVNARLDNMPMSLDDRGFLNVSGFSPSIFKYLMNGEYVGPVELMESVVHSDRYQPIVL